MADLTPVNGATISIGGVLATKTTNFIEADFSGETWVPVDGWETMGGFGDASNLITTALINRGRDTKQKGTRNAGQMDNRFAHIPNDTGQEAVRTAEATANNYAFRVQLNDIPSGGSTPTTFYFIALVMSWRPVGGNANTTLLRAAMLEVNSNVVEVDAA